MSSKQTAGGLARAAALSPERRRGIASAAARARWGDVKKETGVTYLYVIGANGGPLKVGLARDPVWRRNDLQIGNHSELHIHHVAKTAEADGREVERYAHWLLRESAVGGEWFSAPTEEIISAIEAAAIEVAAGKSAPRMARKPGKKKLFDLSDEDVAALERVRVRLGARSHVEALRVLIRQGDAEPKPAVDIKAAHDRVQKTFPKTLAALAEGPEGPAVAPKIVLQVGPAPTAYGSRLKTPKGAKR